MVYRFERIDASQIELLERLAIDVWGNSSQNSARLEDKFDTEVFGAEFLGYAAYEDDGRDNFYPRMPVAYYGVFPTLVVFDGVEVLCAQSGDTMTHPEHQGKGLFIKLAKMTYETAKAEGVEFVFGFPSEQSYPGFARKLDWVFPYRMLRFNRYIPTFPAGFIRRRLGLIDYEFGWLGRFWASKLFDISSSNELSRYRCKMSAPSGIRDERMLNYKANGALFLKHENIGLVLKYDGDISIGDILGSPSKAQTKTILRRLEILAVMLGSSRIRSYFSPKSSLHQVFAGNGRITESLPYGFVCFRERVDPARLELTFLDYDTF